MPQSPAGFLVTLDRNKGSRERIEHEQQKHQIDHSGSARLPVVSVKGVPTEQKPSPISQIF